MNSLLVGATGFVAMLALVFLKMPIGFAMGLVGFLGIWYLQSMGTALDVLSMIGYSSVTNYTLSCVPLFVIMGELAYTAGISRDLYDAGQKWLGRLPGGLAIATTVSCAGFAAICGSSLATAATMGIAAYPEMKKHGYDSRLATGVLAASGTMGSMIPPSIPFALIGYLVGLNVGKLLIAGIIPGVLMMVTYSSVVLIWVWLRPNLAPRGSPAPWKERVASLKGTWSVAILFLLVIGGIYVGAFTPTEGASIGVFGTLVFYIAARRFSWQGLLGSLRNGGLTSVTLLTIVVGAMVFNHFLALTGFSKSFSSMLGASGLEPMGILLAVVVLFLILGCLMDTLAMLFLIMPLVFPIVTNAGFDPIWFSVLVVRLMEVGLITPPIGLNVFVLKGVVRDVPMGDMFRGIVPFLMGDLVNLTLLIMFPQIALFLPNLMKK